MPTNIDASPQEFVKEYVEKEVVSYQHQLTAIINAIKQEAERKIREIERKYEKAALMPEVKKHHVLLGLRLMKDGDCIVYLLPAKIKYEKVKYEGEIYKIKPEYRHVDEGYLGLYAIGKKIVGVKMFDKNLNIIETPHSYSDGFLCVQLREKEVGSVNDVINILNDVKETLKTVNEDSLAHSPEWYKRIQKNWNEAIEPCDDEWNADMDEEHFDEEGY